MAKVTSNWHFIITLYLFIDSRFKYIYKNTYSSFQKYFHVFFLIHIRIIFELFQVTNWMFWRFHLTCLYVEIVQYDVRKQRKYGFFISHLNMMYFSDKIKVILGQPDFSWLQLYALYIFASSIVRLALLMSLYKMNLFIHKN